MKENKKKDGMKTMAIVICIIALILFIINIIVLVHCCDSNWLTLISGWISGLATLAVGLIAYKQSEKYNKENESLKNKVLEIQERIVSPALILDKEQNLSLELYSMGQDLYNPSDFSPNSIVFQVADASVNTDYNQHKLIAKLAFRLKNPTSNYIKSINCDNVKMWANNTPIIESEDKLKLPQGSMAPNSLLNCFINVFSNDKIAFVSNDERILRINMTLTFIDLFDKSITTKINMYVTLEPLVNNKRIGIISYSD